MPVSKSRLAGPSVAVRVVIHRHLIGDLVKIPAYGAGAGDRADGYKVRHGIGRAAVREVRDVVRRVNRRARAVGAGVAAVLHQQIARAVRADQRGTPDPRCADDPRGCRRRWRRWFRWSH